MNKIFKVIWSHATQSWVVVSELTKIKGKSSSSTDKRIDLSRISLIATGAMLLGSSVAFGATTSDVGNGVYTCTTSSLTALGQNATVNMSGSVAIGTNSQATYHGAIAIGDRASATSTGDINPIYAPIAIGYMSEANTNLALALGSKTMAGPLATAIGHDSRAEGWSSTTLGHQSRAFAERSLALGFQTKTRGSSSIAVGDGAEANAQSGLAVGRSANSSASYSTAIGHQARSSGDNANVLGVQSTATANRAITMGSYSHTTGERSALLGSDSTVSGTRSFSVGNNNNVTSNNAGALGANNTVTGENTFVLGNNISVNHSGAVILGNRSQATPFATTTPATMRGENGRSYTYSNADWAGKPTATGAYVSVGGSGSERQIKNVAAGVISASSTDAINGSQLFAVMQRVEKTSWNLTSSTLVGSTGSSSVSSTDNGNQEKISVGETVTQEAGNNLIITQTGNTTRFETSLTPTFTNATFGTGTDKAVLNKDGLTITNGSNTVSLTENGLNNGGKKITKVANGAADDDAVNFSQLNATNQNVTNVSNNLSNLSNLVDGGLTFAGNSGKVKKALNTTVQIEGNNSLAQADASVNNTRVDVDASGKILVKISEDPSFRSVIARERFTVGTGANAVNLTGTANGLDVGGKKITNVADGALTAASSDSVTGKQLFATNQNITEIRNDINNRLSDASLSFTGDNVSAPVKRNLGSTLSIKGNLAQTAEVTDQNLRVDKDGDSLVLKMAKSLTNLTNATFGTGTDKAVLNKDGLTITNGTDTISLTENGLNNGGKKITNVADGVADTDVATVKQLKNLTNVVNGGRISFVGNQGGEVHTPLGNTLSIVGNLSNTADASANNVRVDNDNGKLVVKLSENPTFNSVTAKEKLVIGSGQNTTNLTSTAGGLDVGGDKVTNITSGDLSANSKDAVTGSQLYQTNQNISNLTTLVGGGLNFAGNQGEVLNKKHNNTLSIVGNLSTTAEASAENLRVDSENGNLVVKMAKTLTNLTSMTFGAGDDKAVLNKDGLTITNGTNTVKLTENGLDNGGNKITNVSNGTDANDAVNYSQLDATKRDLANLTSKVGGGLNFEGNKGDLINKAPNATLAIVGGLANDTTASDANVRVDSDNGKLVVKLSENPTFNSVTAKEKLVIGSGQNTTNLTSTAGGLDVGGDKVTNITSGDLSANSKDAVTGSQLYQTNQNISNLTTLVGGGLNFAGNQGEVLNKKHNNTLAIVGNLSTTAEASAENLRVDSDGTQLVVKMAKTLTNLTSMTFGSGTDKAVLDKDGLTITNGTNTVKLTENGLDNGGNKITNVSNGTDAGDAVNYSQLDATKRDLANLTSKVGGGLNFIGNQGDLINKAPNATLAIVGGLENSATASSANVRVDNDNGKLVVKLSENPTFNSVTAKEKLVIGSGQNTTNLTSTAGGLDVGGDKVTNITSGDLSANSKDAVTGSQLYQTNQNISNLTTLVGGGLNFAGNQGEVLNKKHNNTLAIVGNLSTTAEASAENLRVDSDGTQLVVKMAKTLTNLTSMTFGSGTDKAVLDKDGLTITNGTNTVKLTENGLDNGGNKITNVSNGTDANDAVNYSQLDATKRDLANLTSKVGGGLNFIGNQGDLINKAPNATLAIVGGLENSATASSANVRVDSESGKLVVKISENPSFTTVTIGKDGNTTTISSNDRGLDLNGKKVTNITSGDLTADSKEAVTGSQLYQTNQNLTNLSTLVDGGLNFAGNQGAVLNKKHNDTLAIVGGLASDQAASSANIRVDSDGEKLVVKISENPTFASVTATEKVVIGSGANSTTLTSNEKGLDLGGRVVTNVAQGNISSGSTDVVTAGQVYDLIEGGVSYVGNDGKAVKRKLGETLAIKGGLANDEKASSNNLRVDNENGELVLKMAKALSDLTSATFTNGNATSVVNGNGLTITNGTTTVSLTDKGLDNGGNVIRNVADGQVTADSKDVVNGSQLYAVKAVAENANAGWNLTANGTNLSNVAPKSTVDLNNKDGNINLVKKENAITFDLNPNVKLGNASTQSSLTLFGEAGSGANVNITAAKGQTTVNTKDNREAIDRIVYNSTTATGESVKREVATMDDGLIFAGDTGTTNKQLGHTVTIEGGQTDQNQLVQAPNIGVVAKDGKLSVQLSKDIQLGENGSLKAGEVTIDQNGIKTGDVTINKGGIKAGDVAISKDGIDMAGKKITNVADGDVSADSKELVNGGQLYQTNQNVANVTQSVAKGWNVKADSVAGTNGVVEVENSQDSNMAMGDSLTIKAARNIKIKQNGKNLEVGMVENPEFSQITTGNITVRPNSTVDMGGNRIQNVADGKKDSDAVTVRQLKAVENRMNKENKALRGGIASTAAAGGIPQVMLPGKSVVGAAAATYDGSTAIAVGYSRASDDGKVILKVSGSTNSSGKFLGVAGVGYQW